jgi:hypothetical protein
VNWSLRPARARRHLQGAASWIFSRSPWPSASILALALLCVVDLLLPPRPIGAPFAVYLMALALFVALIHGTLWSLTFWCVRRLPRPLAWAFWPIVSFACGIGLARQLGAFTRLHSRYWKLAVGVLAVCSVTSLLFGAVCTAFQPSVRHPAGFIAERAHWLRVSLGVLLLAAASGLQVADRMLFPDQYRDAHTALRLGSLWLVMMALVAGRRRLLRLTALHWSIALAGYSACLYLLDGHQTAALNAFDARRWPAAVLQVSRSFVDWDHDGYASLLGGSDCAPWNPRVHPGANDIPGNGIDENCALGDAKPRSQAFEWPPVPNEPSPIDVVLITVDAFNLEHLGLYNSDYGPNGRATSPNLDRWAQQATVFDHAYSAGGWTSIAVPALLRGLNARRLVWTKYFETNLYAMLREPLAAKLRAGERATQMFPLAFDDPHPPLAELLTRRGMYCMAVTDDGYSAMLEHGTGVERGFAVYRQVDSLPVSLENDAGTAATALDLLAKAPSDRRFFMWVHFFGTHWPDETHPGVRTYGFRPKDLYDHEVAFLDSQLVHLLDGLAARSRPVAVIISADHGEGLNAFTRTHGLTLDEPVIRVPLLARVPGWAAGHVTQLVSSLDLVPTILALTRTPPPTYLDGVDIAALTAAPRPRVLFSDTWRFKPNQKLDIDLAAAYDGTRKVIYDHVSGNLYSVSQTESEATPQLIGMTPIDALSGSVYAYVEETGALRLRD